MACLDFIPRECGALLLIMIEWIHHFLGHNEYKRVRVRVRVRVCPPLLIRAGEVADTLTVDGRLVTV